MRNPTRLSAQSSARTLTLICLIALLALAGYSWLPGLRRVLAEGLRTSPPSDITGVVSATNGDSTFSSNGKVGVSFPTRIAAQPQSPMPAGKIAFQSGGHIWVMNADGTSPTDLSIINGVSGFQPAFSPDGSRIAFMNTNDAGDLGLFRIFVMNADGTSPTRLSGFSPIEDRDPAFSPDGSKIVFASNRDGNREIYVMNADGTNPTRLTNNPARDGQPSFSGDGSKIVFESFRDGDWEIYIMNADGTGHRNLTNNPAPDTNAVFSPTAGKTAFTSVSSGQEDIWIMNADGTGQTPLTTNLRTDDEATFSPDGSMIAFRSLRDGNTDIYVMNTDGTNQTRVPNNENDRVHPFWAPGSVVSLAINNVSVVEGNSGTNMVTFTVTKTGSATQNVTVRVDTADGTAAAPDDYESIDNQTLTFLPAETMKTVVVMVNGDSVREPDETFFVNLSNATNAFIGDAQGVGTIVNDDSTLPIRTLPSLLQVVIFEQTIGDTPHVIRFPPNAVSLGMRLPDPLSANENDFSFFNEEYYDAFYSNGDGTPNPSGAFLTIEGVWRDRSMAPPFTPGKFGGMNINQVLLLYPDGTQDFGDFVSAFRMGSICLANNPDLPDQCIIGSESRAVDGNPLTFPRFGHTSDMNPNERFFLTIGFNGVSGPPSQSTAQFNSADQTAAEGAGKKTVTVTRTGDTSGESSVKYTTTEGTGGSRLKQPAASANGAASDRGDYTAAQGTVHFGRGETTKTFDVLITDDAYDDDDETFQITLSDPTGATLGPQSTATVQIIDNDAVNGPSPVRNGSFNPQFYVRQHYSDFLGREPDTGGLNFWVGQTSFCGSPDLQICRINVSGAFFLSIEYQESGFLVFRTHKAAFGNLPGKPVPIELREFLAGSSRIGDGVRVGIGNWEQQLEANKVAFFDEFVTGAQFLTLYNGSTNAQYVDALNQNAGGALSQSERDAVVSALNAGTMTRAAALRAVAEDSDFAVAERNRAFVLAQYFGYLRRDPDAAPDTNFDGYNFWLAKLNQFNGNFIQAEMVKAFIQSIEYGDRFGQ
ncbi:MAG: hypothetical protein ND895_07665 [Pyrinomonadaceae bacterium]|nr:hypothetical protein [Pyrinomonadaceae bacterium]